MESLKYTVLIDYIIKTLKDIKGLTGSRYASLVSIFKIFKQPYNIGDIIDIAKYIETRGWVKTIEVIGDVRVLITTTGVVYVEQKETDEFFVKGYNEFIAKIKEESNGKALLITLSEENYDPKLAITIILDDVIKKVDGDYKQDVEVIKIEMTKSNPDLNLIERKLNSLEQNESVKVEIRELKTHFNLD